MNEMNSGLFDPQILSGHILRQKLFCGPLLCQEGDGYWSLEVEHDPKLLIQHSYIRQGINSDDFDLIIREFTHHSIPSLHFEEKSALNWFHLPQLHHDTFFHIWKKLRFPRKDARKVFEKFQNGTPFAQSQQLLASGSNAIIISLVGVDMQDEILNYKKIHFYSWNNCLLTFIQRSSTSFDFLDISQNEKQFRQSTLYEGLKHIARSSDVYYTLSGLIDGSDDAQFSSSSIHSSESLSPNLKATSPTNPLSRMLSLTLLLCFVNLLPLRASQSLSSLSLQISKLCDRIYRMKHKPSHTQCLRFQEGTAALESSLQVVRALLGQSKTCLESFKTTLNWMNPIFDSHSLHSTPVPVLTSVPIPAQTTLGSSLTSDPSPLLQSVNDPDLSEGWRGGGLLGGMIGSPRTHSEPRMDLRAVGSEVNSTAPLPQSVSPRNRYQFQFWEEASDLCTAFRIALQRADLLSLEVSRIDVDLRQLNSRRAEGASVMLAMTAAFFLPLTALTGSQSTVHIYLFTPCSPSLLISLSPSHLPLMCVLGIFGMNFSNDGFLTWVLDAPHASDVFWVVGLLSMLLLFLLFRRLRVLDLLWASLEEVNRNIHVPTRYLFRSLRDRSASTSSSASEGSSATFSSFHDHNLHPKPSLPPQREVFNDRKPSILHSNWTPLSLSPSPSLPLESDTDEGTGMGTDEPFLPFHTFPPPPASLEGDEDGEGDGEGEGGLEVYLSPLLGGPIKRHQ